MTQIADFATFALPANADEAAFLAAAKSARAQIAARPGFIASSLSKGDDGQWTDHTVWADMDSAKAAMDWFMTNPECAAFAGHIDQSSLNMRHEVQHMAA